MSTSPTCSSSSTNEIDQRKDHTCDVSKATNVPNSWKARALHLKNQMTLTNIILHLTPPSHHHIVKVKAAMVNVKVKNDEHSISKIQYYENKRSLNVWGSSSLDESIAGKQGSVSDAGLQVEELLIDSPSRGAFHRWAAKVVVTHFNELVQSGRDKFKD
ncbi:hypothetical protein BS17DRAFT_770721 [Gyrodon lividus]|nr:hypothetical protein BS17DRAFT_770721 [Gyrodon lividus]